MRIRLTSVVLLVVFSSIMSGAGATLAPGQVLQATFTSVPNSSDMIQFFTTDSLTVTGSPVLTTQLYNGTTLLGTTVGPLLAGRFYEAVFESPSSTFIPGAEPSTVVDLTSMKNGTIQGMIKVTISGGTISGFSLSDFWLYDAVSSGTTGYFPEGDLANEVFGLNAPSPTVPALSEWGLVLLAIALIGAAMAALWRAPGTRRVSG